MKKIKKIAVVILSMVMCISAFGANVYASELSGDLIDNFELTDISFSNVSGDEVYKIEAGDITCSANVINNTSEAKELVLLSAHYSNSGSVLSVDVDQKTVGAKNNSGFEATVNVSDEAGTVKTFVWDVAGQRPYKTVASLTSLSSKKFDEAWMTYQKAGGSDSAYKKSYKGIVDEQKGTITFEIPFSISDSKYIKNISKLGYASFYFAGSSDGMVTCTGGIYTGSSASATLANGEEYVGQVFNQVKPKSGQEFVHGGWVNASAADGYEITEIAGNWNSINISGERPVFTFTAEDGSKSSYKVNVLFTVVDDDFSDATSTSDTAFTSGGCTWTVSKPASGEAGVAVDEDGNKYITVSRTNPVENAANYVSLNLHSHSCVLLDNIQNDDTNTWVSLGDNVEAYVEYDFRFRDVVAVADGAEIKAGETGSNHAGYSYDVGNGRLNEYFSRLSLRQVVDGVMSVALNDTTDVKGQEFSKDTWHNAKMLVEADRGKYDSTTLKYSGTNQSYAYLNNCNTGMGDLRGSKGINGTYYNKGLTVSAFRLITSSNATTDRIGIIDVDNLKIGLMFK